MKKARGRAEISSGLDQGLTAHLVAGKIVLIAPHQVVTATTEIFGRTIAHLGNVLPEHNQAPCYNSRMNIFGPFVTFILFTLGLLAWRLQLIDKRRFEVAEEVLVKYAKMAALLKASRQRNAYLGFREFRAEREPDTRYSEYLLLREWKYRIPDEIQKEWDAGHRDAVATAVQAEIYLSTEIRETLSFPVECYRGVQEAAAILDTISPYPSIDPCNEEPYPDPDYPDLDDDYLTNDQEQDLERVFFSVRFETATPGHAATDELSLEIGRRFAKLQEMCRPYTNQNPYRFLYRFAQSLRPHPGWWEKARTGKLD